MNNFDDDALTGRHAGRDAARTAAETQRFETTGRLASALAHDLNSLLTTILGYGELLMDSLADDPRQGEIEELLHAARNASAISRQLVAFTRRESTRPTTVDLNATMVQMQRLFCRVVGEHVDVAFALDERLPAIHADPAEVEQAIVSLALCLRGRIPSGARLEVRTQAAAGKPEDAAPDPVVLESRAVGGSEPPAGPPAPGAPPPDVDDAEVSALAAIVRQCGGQVQAGGGPGSLVFRLYFPMAGSSG